MIIRQLLCFVNLLFLFGHNTIYSQTVMSVMSLDGEGYEIILSARSCVTFFSDSVAISPHLETDSIIQYAMDNVRKVQFVDYTVTNVKNVNKNHLLLYPNPVCDYLAIGGTEEDICTLIIYNTSGIEVLSTYYNRGDIVDVSRLNPGYYIIRAGDWVGKFVKK